MNPKDCMRSVEEMKLLEEISALQSEVKALRRVADAAEEYWQRDSVLNRSKVREALDALNGPKISGCFSETCKHLNSCTNFGSCDHCNEFEPNGRRK